MPSLLELEGVFAGYGPVPVLHGLDLSVHEGEIVAVLGANGVGKTTMLRTACGLLRPWSGSISFEGRRIDGLRAEQVASLGVSTIPEPPAVFRDMSVLDNIRLGTFASGRTTGVDQVLETFPVLANRLTQQAGSLSGGEQRMLALARGIASRPRLLLVDEVSMGLAPPMVARVFDLLLKLRSEGLTVCMVEQNASALDIADRAYILEKGRVVKEAAARTLSKTRHEIARAYLGASNSSTSRKGRRP